MISIGQRPLRIWHVNITKNSAPVDGIAVAVDQLVKWQRHLGHEVTHVQYLPRDLPPDSDRRPDVVHFHSVFRPMHARLAYQLYRAGIPYVVSPHSGLAKDALQRDRARKRAYLAVCERTLLAHAAAVMCLTDTEAEEVRAAGADVRYMVVPNIAPSFGQDSPSWTPSGERPNLVCLSRFDVWQKGLDELAMVASWLPEADVTVYGGPDHNQPQRVDQLRRSAPGNFHLAAPVHAAEKARVLGAASLYVQTSRWEGLSMAVIEAMAAGIPCAVSTYIARSMGLTDGATALVLCSDPPHAAAQIRTALGNRQHLRAMAQGAHDRVNAQYNGHTVATASVAAYRSAIRARTDRLLQRRAKDRSSTTTRTALVFGEGKPVSILRPLTK
jgi:glycosyltransferase involved in cell wall biosynthesis